MTALQTELFKQSDTLKRPLSYDEFLGEIVGFDDFHKKTAILEFPDTEFDIPVYVNEFWTSRQRAAHSLHEVSYRACFKPQLPRFFIERLTRPGDAVYDPFLGRGTTAIEAALLGRRPIGTDINPLSEILVAPRLDPPPLAAVSDRLSELPLGSNCETRDDLLAFYHPNTLRQITNLRGYLLAKREDGSLDAIDRWIRMVATNRLTGHSPGFFSVYTLPPNQTVTVERQQGINRSRKQTPPERDVRVSILKKSRSLLGKLQEDDIDNLRASSKKALLITGSSDVTPEIQSDSVGLVVTSPPFLDVVDYKTDNWLRFWFNGIDAQSVQIWHFKKPREWQTAMTRVFAELRRVLKPEGFVAFEVGEVRGGKILLESLVVPAASEAGLEPLMVLVNDQVFTKTSNCWGVENLKKGTNTNRIVLLRKL
ncbi:MAG: DNA methyltransferase [Gemmatimonadetes bacterium]|nr:DNA methyltransferase [Gemmatimonadota bacterium]MDE3259635.1 DNA methyltransferase [Gemmatimonadota bacterium]